MSRRVTFAALAMCVAGVFLHTEVMHGLSSSTASAQDKQTPKVTNKIEPLPKDLEIQLALSALPPHLSEKATVYILNPGKGFEVDRKGSNGFHALVARTALARPPGPLRADRHLPPSSGGMRRRSARPFPVAGDRRRCC